MRTTIPAPRTRTIPRPRLTRLLTRWRELRLMQIVAPAGYGKTTLAGAWIHSLAAFPAQERPFIAWITLMNDIGAAQLMRLWIDALMPHIPSIHELLNVDGNIEPTTSSRLISFCREIDAAGRDIVLVLDDVHLVAEPAAYALLQRLLDAAPATLHILLLSRSTPPLQVGPLILDDALLTLDIHDLEFDHEEFLAFAHEFGIDAQPAAALADLERRSTGWVTALKLLTYDLRLDFSNSRALPGEATSRTALDHFFDSRVLAALAPDLHRIVELAAVLPYMTGELLAAVTERPLDECADLLRALVAANAFVSAFDDSRADAVAFRFHPLFHDFLRRRFPALDDDARRRAVVWLCDHEDVDAALDLLQSDGGRQTADGGWQTIDDSTGNDHPSSVVHLPSSVVDSLAAAVRRAALRYDLISVKRWLRRIPEESITAHAPLAVAVGWHTWFTNELGPAEMRACWQRAADAASAMPPGPQRDELCAETHLLRAIGEMFLGNREASRALVDAAQRLLTTNDGLAAGYVQMLQIVLMPPTLDADSAADEQMKRLQIAVDAFRRAGFSHGILETMVAQVLLLWRRCRFEHAQVNAAHTQAVMIQEGWRYSTYTLDLAYLRGEMYYLTDQRTEARTHLQRAVEYGALEASVSPELTYASQALLQLCDAIEGRPRCDADADADEWARIVRTVNIVSQGMAAWPRLLRDFHAGRIEACRLTLESLNLSPSAVDANTPDRLRLAVLAGAVFSGRTDDVIAEQLTAFHDSLAAAGFDILRLHVQAVRIVHALQTSEVESARRLLHSLLPEIQHAGMVRLLLDLPPLQSLLAEHNVAAPPPSTHTPAVHTLHDYGLTRQERRILTLLADDLDPKTIAATLSLGVSTVRSHIIHVYRKLGVHSRDEAVRVWKQGME